MRLLLPLALLLIAPSVFAQDGGMTFSPVQHDVSVSFLAQVFGSVNGVLHSNSTQLLGHMFGIFNAAVLAVGGVIFGYTSGVSLLSSAHDGEFLGKKYHSMYIPLRTAVGFAALIPKSTGYSAIQVFVMWIVLQGVGAADSIWYTAVSYLYSGGAVAPVTTEISTDTKDELLGSMTALFQRQICMAGLNAATNKPGGSGKRLSAEVITNKDSKPVSIVFPGDKNSIYYGKCGAITWSDKGDKQLADANVTGLLTAMTDTEQYARRLVEHNPSITGQLLDPSTPYDMKDTDSIPISIAIWGAAQDYYAAVQPILREKAKAQTEATSDDEEREKLTRRGWMMAGGYYYLLAKKAHANTLKTVTIPELDMSKKPIIAKQNTGLPDEVVSAIWAEIKAASKYENLAQYYADEAARDKKEEESADNLNLAVETNDFNIGKDINPVHAGESAIDSAKETVKIWKFHVPVPDIGGALFNRVASHYTDMLNADGPAMVTTIGRSALRPLAVQLPNLVKKWKKRFQHYMQDNKTRDPLITLQNFGMAVVQGAQQTWLDTAAALAFAGLAFGFGSFGLALGGIIAMLMVVIPVILAVMFGMFMVGIMLAYYLPALPFILFTFGALAWLVGVIEAMIAAPIVGLGIIHPDGHDHYGKAEPAIMLLLSAFLRPSLMIFGLLGGMILSYVGFTLINMGFGSVIDGIAHMANIADNGADKSNTFDWVGGATFLVIYTSLIVAVAQKCFMLIHEVPDRVLRWLGGQDQLGSGKGGEEMVRGAVGQAGSTVGQGMQKGTEASQQAAMSGAKAVSKSDKDKWS